MTCKLTSTLLCCLFKIGPRDLAAKQVKMVRRDTGKFIHLFIHPCLFCHCVFNFISSSLIYCSNGFRNSVLYSPHDLLLCITGEKIDINVADASTIVPALLITIQSDMFIKAKAGRDEKMATVLKWEDFVPALEKDCLVLTPFCDLAEWEEKVKVCNVLLLSSYPILCMDALCGFYSQQFCCVQQIRTFICIFLRYCSLKYTMQHNM